MGTAAVLVGVQTLSTASKLMSDSIRAVYGTARSLNDFFNDHIQEMKDSDNPTSSRTGRVLESAKEGFGIGFAVPVVIIATGQLILGNPLSMAIGVATAPLNPIAMTCAAVGAVYYGWNALSDQEKDEIIEKLSKGFEIGTEMVKSIMRFLIDKTRELLSEENLEEIKGYIKFAAEFFGKSLGKVTKKIVDIISETVDSVMDIFIPKKWKKVDASSQGDAPLDQESAAPPTIRLKLTGKGQLTIPSEVRQQLGLSPHSEVEFSFINEELTLRKCPAPPSMP